MADDLICSICMVRFNVSSRKPLFLACGHTFCRQCLLAIQARGKLRCPNCNSEDERGVEGLSRNLTVLELLVKGVVTAEENWQDPWQCRKHPGEVLLYLRTGSGELVCEECAKEGGDRVEKVDERGRQRRLERYRSLYEQAEEQDLEARLRFLTCMELCMRGEQARALLSAEEAFTCTISQLDSAVRSEKDQVESYYGAQAEKLRSVSRLLSAAAARNLQAQSASNTISLLSTPIPPPSPARISYTLPDIYPSPLTLLLSSTHHKCFQESAGQDNPSEYRLARFSSTGLRWGVLPSAQQVEALSFQVCRPIWLTAIGLGGPYYPKESMRCMELEVLEGRKTRGTRVGGLRNVEMGWMEKGVTGVKVRLDCEVKIRPFCDYTIRVVFEGTAGVYRGSGTARTVVGEKGVDFVFSKAEYIAPDQTNGCNLTDGPILELYYALSFNNLTTLYRPIALAQPRATWTESVILSPTEKIVLRGIGLVGAAERDKPAVVRGVVLGCREKGEVLMGKPVLAVMGDGQSDYLLGFPQQPLLLPTNTYELSFQLTCTGGLKLLHNQEFPPSSLLAITAKDSNCELTALTRLMVSPGIQPESSYGKIQVALREIPAEVVEKAGGEVRIIMHEGESGEERSEWNERPLIFQVDKSLLLTGLIVTGPVQVYSLQIYKDRQLLYTLKSAVPALATELTSLWEVPLCTPVLCLPDHRYTVALVLSSLPSSFQPLPTSLSGPSASIVKVVQWDSGQVKGLKVQAEKVEDGERWVQECMWRLWEGEPEEGKREEWGVDLRPPTFALPSNPSPSLATVSHWDEETSDKHMRETEDARKLCE